ncbi:hypothetical protein LSAT2_002969 [Lamellibrachia satsuma]|nr:hypothetical protein LSAT2_002969 [Lamellibrachia satsuma]
MSGFLGRLRTIFGLQIRPIFTSKRCNNVLQKNASLSCDWERTYATEASRGLKVQEKLRWSYVHGAASTPLIGVTIGQKLQDMTEAHPEREAMVFCRANVRYTFEQLLTQVNRGQQN